MNNIYQDFCLQEWAPSHTGLACRGLDTAQEGKSPVRHRHLMLFIQVLSSTLIFTAGKAYWCVFCLVSRNVSLSRSGGGTLLDKIQKAAEVVASAVLPPTEHPGIRLHDNHYHAVVAPSATVEMAVPACAYNIPSHGHRGEPCTRF